MTPEEIEATNHALQRSYRTVFAAPAGQIVLRDLMQVGRFRKSVPDDASPTALAIAEGRRQMLLRIMNMMSLEPEQLQALYGGRDAKMGETR
jgi:hypothetical protein